MPRSARIDIPGLLQHVIVRGIERRDIFLDDRDRSLFVGRLSSLLVETGMECLAWSMLTNHFHLLLRCRQVELSRFMRRLLTRLCGQLQPPPRAERSSLNLITTHQQQQMRELSLYLIS